jgi:hypothetical protein
LALAAASMTIQASPYHHMRTTTSHRHLHTSTQFN